MMQILLERAWLGWIEVPKHEIGSRRDSQKEKNKTQKGEKTFITLLTFFFQEKEMREGMCPGIVAQLF